MKYGEIRRGVGQEKGRKNGTGMIGSRHERIDSLEA